MSANGHIILKTVLLPAVLLVAAACSVKEDRRECPVYVTVLTDRFVERGLNDGTLSFASDQPIRREAVNFLSLLRVGFTQPCPKDYARVSVVSGVENGTFSDGALTVRPGMQADPVWAYAETFSVDADAYLIDAGPHKQYCLVKFTFGGSSTAPPDYPWRFRVKAECAGMDLYTLEPLTGFYSAPVGPNAVGEWYCILPRQRSNNMQLEIFLPDAGSETAGRTDYVVDLGRAFEEKGYDWTLEDLKDIEVQVGFSNATVTLTVCPWDGDDSQWQVEI